MRERERERGGEEQITPKRKKRKNISVVERKGRKTNGENEFGQNI